MVEAPNDDSENPPERPGRHSRRWSVEEENKIIEELKEGKSWGEIAQNHSRTVRAVQMRFARICEHAEHLEVVRKTATEEDSRGEPPNPLPSEQQTALEGPPTYMVVDPRGKGTITGRIVATILAGDELW